MISRYVLPKIGEGWARALYLTGERFGPDVAQRIGLVHWIDAENVLDRTVEEKVGALLSSGPHSVRECKSLIARSRGLDSSGMRELTTERIAAVRTSREGQEGLRAFLEKRAPEWTLRGEERR